MTHGYVDHGHRHRGTDKIPAVIENGFYTVAPFGGNPKAAGTSDVFLQTTFDQGTNLIVGGNKLSTSGLYWLQAKLNFSGTYSATDYVVCQLAVNGIPDATGWAYEADQTFPLGFSNKQCTIQNLGYCFQDDDDVGSSQTSSIQLVVYRPVSLALTITGHLQVSRVG